MFLQLRLCKMAARLLPDLATWLTTEPTSICCGAIFVCCPCARVLPPRPDNVPTVCSDSSCTWWLKLEHASQQNMTILFCGALMSVLASKQAKEPYMNLCVLLFLYKLARVNAKVWTPKWQVISCVPKLVALFFP